MAGSSRGLPTQFNLKLKRLNPIALDTRKRRKLWLETHRVQSIRINCSSSDSVTPIRRTTSSSGNCADEKEPWQRFDLKKSPHTHRVGVQASPALPFASAQSFMQQEKFYPRCTPRNSGPQSRDTPPPPKRDTGIASEKDWSINLLNENVNESGNNEDGSSWYRESGKELGENGYRCRWTRMGGQSHDGSSEWKETWWEKSDWTGYKELGVEKSGRNAEGDSWWETWEENLHQDDWSNIAKIERSAQKQAKSGTENAGWYEKWWEKYDAKGWTEKGAHKYGRLNEQSWWEQWGEHYDGRGSVVKWFFSNFLQPNRQINGLKLNLGQSGETSGMRGSSKALVHVSGKRGTYLQVANDMLMHIRRLRRAECLYDHGVVSNSAPDPSSVGSCSEDWSRTWGEEHFGNGKVHKYGQSTTWESWDIVVDEETYYEAEPHYGWADVVGDSSQLLSIEPRERPPGVFPNLNFGPTLSPPSDDPSEELPPS